MSDPSSSVGRLRRSVQRPRSSLNACGRLGGCGVRFLIYPYQEPMRKQYAHVIDKRATELLRKLNLLDVPVNVEAVAERLGANVVYDDLEDDVSGFLLKEKD